MTSGPGNQKAHFHVTRPPPPPTPPAQVGAWLLWSSCPLLSRWQSPGASLPP